MTERKTTQPHSFGTLIRIAWEIYTTRFGYFFGVTTALYFPLYFIYDFLPRATEEQIAQWGILTADGGVDLATITNSTEVINALAVDWFAVDPVYILPAAGLSVLMGLVSLLVTIAVIQGVRNVVTKTPPLKWHEGLRTSTQYFWPVLVSVFIAGVLQSLLTLVLIIPGIIAWVWWSFVIEAVVLEDKKFWTALRYSRELVRGRWLQVFAYIIGISAITALVGLLLLSASSPFAEIPVANALSRLILDIVMVFGAVFSAIYFFQLQATKKASTSAGSTNAGA